MKSPITKLQVPNKFQYSITKHQTKTYSDFLFGYLNLVIGYCLVIVSWLLVISLCDILYAQETEKSPIEVNGDEVEYLPNEKKVIGTGNVSIYYKNAELRSDKIIVNTETKDVEAIGNVILKTPTSEVRGEKVLYNFDEKKGEILNAGVRTGDWYSGGDKIELYPDGSLEVKEGYLTSCNLDKPHYRIHSKKVVIYPNNKVVAKNVVLKAGNVPVGYLPKYNYSLKADWPTLNAMPGKRKKWGVFLLTNYRYEIDEANKVTLKLDERENWGLAEGLDYKYRTDSFGEGLFKTYYTYQRDKDRNETLRAEEERYRVQLRHRWAIDKGITGIMEYHRLSDVDFTKDYFYREEYDREASPESYMYLLDGQSEYSASFLAQKRVNRFQSVVEKTPSLRFDLKDQQISDSPIYFKTDTSFASLNSKFGNNSSEDLDAMRFDTFNKVTTRLQLQESLNISPFVGTRYTSYSKDSDGNEDKDRTAFYTGVDVSTKFFRTYDSTGRFLGVDFNELHHIITPTLEYEYIHEPSMVPNRLQQFDDIDSINKKNKLTMGLENRLKTKRLVDGKLTSFDLGYLLLTEDYIYKLDQGSRFSNLKADFELTPYDWLRIESDTQYDPESKDFQSWNSDLYIQDNDDLRIGFGSRYWENQEHEIASDLWKKLNNKWSIGLFTRYDLKEIQTSGHKVTNRFDTKQIVIVRDLHCWIAEASFDVTRDGDATFWLAFKLKASPKVPFDFKDYYAPPKR